jgi:hypothetical protein
MREWLRQRRATLPLLPRSSLECVVAQLFAGSRILPLNMMQGLEIPALVAEAADNLRQRQRVTATTRMFS